MNSPITIDGIEWEWRGKFKDGRHWLFDFRRVGEKVWRHAGGSWFENRERIDERAATKQVLRFHVQCGCKKMKTEAEYLESLIAEAKAWVLEHIDGTESN